jgi:NAD(P)H-hydrate epimerase
VFIHGLAGDIAGDSFGPDGITASDIMNSVPLAIKQVRTMPDELRKNYFPRIV